MLLPVLQQKSLAEWVLGKMPPDSWIGSGCLHEVAALRGEHVLLLGNGYLSPTTQSTIRSLLRTVNPIVVRYDNFCRSEAMPSVKPLLWALTAKTHVRAIRDRHTSCAVLAMGPTKSFNREALLRIRGCATLADPVWCHLRRTAMLRLGFLLLLVLLQVSSHELLPPLFHSFSCFFLLFN